MIVVKPADAGLLRFAPPLRVTTLRSRKNVCRAIQDGLCPPDWRAHIRRAVRQMVAHLLRL